MLMGNVSLQLTPSPLPLPSQLPIWSYMAVCQSHSGLPCGGFYTSVFTDSERPVVLATITAFGQGAVTRPLRCNPIVLECVNK